jgi:3-mercaptopyruvate sulfurtransferase SseA
MPGRTQVQYETLLGDDKDALIVVYCGFVKCARSHNAAIFAQQLGYTNVKRYAGGIYAWKGSGLPVESCESIKSIATAHFRYLASDSKTCLVVLKKLRCVGSDGNSLRRSFYNRNDRTLVT